MTRTLPALAATLIIGLLAAPAAQQAFSGETGFLRHFYIDDPGATPKLWIEIMAYLAISLGTLFGGWRIVHTMGSRITRLRPVGGFCAETGGAISILLATKLGIPVSTTHTISGSIVGVGAARKVSAVRWNVASNIVTAWVITLPASALIAALFYVISGLFG
jgi:PiT family inorganic phosphate transporter